MDRALRPAARKDDTRRHAADRWSAPVAPPFRARQRRLGPGASPISGRSNHLQLAYASGIVSAAKNAIWTTKAAKPVSLGSGTRPLPLGLSRKSSTTAWIR